MVDCVELAATANCPCVVITVKDSAAQADLFTILSPAVKCAEERGVMLLVETVGRYAKTQNVLTLLRAFGSAAMGVAWNVRETYFRGKESADTTIQTLGAYINYVLVGDEPKAKSCATSLSPFAQRRSSLSKNV